MWITLDHHFLTFMSFLDQDNSMTRPKRSLHF